MRRWKKEMLLSEGGEATPRYPSLSSIVSTRVPPSPSSSPPSFYIPGVAFTGLNPSVVLTHTIGWA